MCLHWISIFSFVEGDFDRAAELNQKAEEYAEKAADQNLFANIWFLCARMARLTGDAVKARNYAKKILQITDLGTAAKSLGYVEISHQAVESGEMEKASDFLREGIRLVYRDKFFTNIWIMVDAVAYLTASQNQQERAALLFGSRWSRGWYRCLSPQERDQRQKAMIEIKDSLGDSRFEQLYTEGGKLSLEQVVTLALEVDDQDSVTGPFI